MRDEGSGIPRISVVVCSFNGAAGVDRVLAALIRQTIIEEMEIVLVDDASTDGTAGVGWDHGVRVISHPTNLGLGAARNTGVTAVHAPIVAFLDDDCEPAADWAARILDGYSADDVIGVGGAIETSGPRGYMTGYLTRHSPLLPLELDLAVSPHPAYRFVRYLARNWQAAAPAERRRVFSLVGANMSFRIDALRKIGGFDDAMRFGSEDLDICLRLRAEYGDTCLSVEPSAVVVHHFKSGLGDTLRRSRAYGRGHALMLAKYPEMRPTVFPLPVATVGLLAIAARRPKALLLAAALPHAVHPGGLRAVVDSGPVALLDPYVALLQEASVDLGVVEGLRRSRVHSRSA